ncbi:cysteine desulfurase family protein [Aureibacter tunicatorum]|uniref:cysteine desulfurase n=1 Tax=Aureibacter tunicatorum TaxID=866807 RepID=A0AAE3XJ38_9BACT|nr:cysteine desulfurase family protein [Aureibacter tunicatorum]MDR6237797.1 cysteine desulfurase [Aureibacter tunicatorum]BDD02832.1 cysteine desulfurase [Aureibacter tunicatorum]
MKVYFDNAATTPMDPAVFEAMRPYLLEYFGNPSSTHSHGREAKAAVEKSRKTIAKMVGAKASEIYFTSGATEADNLAIRSFIDKYNLEVVVSSPFEHPAVLNTIAHLESKGVIKSFQLNFDNKGNLDLGHLTNLLEEYGDKTLVSLMYANSEIGNITPVDKVAKLCKEHGAYFHTDAVQAVAHLPINVEELKVDALAASAHKFHGPKGVGFLYVNQNSKIPSFIKGGGQERSVRAGTENVASIVGMAKALEIACENLDSDMAKVRELKSYMKDQLIKAIPEIAFNGESGDLDNSLCTVLNASLPANKQSGMLLFTLDLAGISASGGSACSSGALQGSHVLTALNADSTRPSVRFSFSKLNTMEEVDFVVAKLKEVYSA